MRACVGVWSVDLMQVETRRGLIDRNNRLATKDHKWVANDDDR